MIEASKTNPLPRPLLLFAAVSGSLTVLLWLPVAIAALLHHDLTPVWPLVPRGTTFFDLKIYLERFLALHSAAFFYGPGYPYTYFAPGVPLYRLFYLFGPQGVVPVYLAVVAAALLLAFIALRRAMLRYSLRPAQVTAFLLLAIVSSYPILFAVERGNLEIVLAAGAAAGIGAYWSGRPTLAAVLWGVFGSVKIYPLLLLCVFLSRRQTRQLLLSLAVAAATTLLSLLYAGPSLPVAIAGIRTGTHAFLHLYSMTFAAFTWDHSLFMLLKLLTAGLHPKMKYLLVAYVLTAAAIMLPLYFKKIRKLPLANQILILSICTVILPPTSFDYTLVQLYGAWAVLVFVALRARGTAHLTPIFLLLALVFTPSNYVVLHHVGYAGQAKCLVLLALFGLALRYPFHTPTVAVMAPDQAAVARA